MNNLLIVKLKGLNLYFFSDVEIENIEKIEEILNTVVPLTPDSLNNSFTNLVYKKLQIKLKPFDSCKIIRVK